MQPAKWLLISDLHVPYHDEHAIELAVQTAVDEGCDSVVINGDGLDFYMLSRFVKDPRFRSTKGELDTFRQVAAYIAEPFARKVYKLGNHCDRWNTYIWQNAPAFADVPEVSFANVTGLEAAGWEVIESIQHYTLGDLNVFHGHELPRGLTDPVNVGRGVYLRVRESAIVGHWHKTSTHLESGGITKKVTTCYSTGCLCDMRPAYASVNSWNQGFAIVDVGSDGSWNVSNRTIDRGRVYRTE
jgi:predicted phosphodiesterase